MRPLDLRRGPARDCSGECGRTRGRRTVRRYPARVPLTPGTVAILVVTGIAAGVINTLAGSGSFLTLPVLILLGLPAGVANATNRPGILAAALVGAETFRRSGVPVGAVRSLFLPAALGGLAGAWIATVLDPRAMHVAIGVLMLVLLAMLVFDPGRWLRAHAPASEAPRALRPRTFAIFFAVGVYGGFIQAGVGLFLLAALVLEVGVSLKHANALKLLLVLVFTVPAVCWFIGSALIDWPVALVVAAGQVGGAALAARFATKSPRADVWIRRVLIVVLAVTVLDMFGVLERLGVPAH